jgi:hypothetical protein
MQVRVRQVAGRGQAQVALPWWSREDTGMVAAYVTPAHALLLLAVLLVFFVLTRLSRGDAHAAGAARGRRLRSRVRGWRLGKPTRRQVHVAWLVFSALVAFALTRGIAVPVFLLVFFGLWMAGFGVLRRMDR